MTVRLNARDFAAIRVVESYAELREPLFDLLDWPDLTLEQRGLCALIWVAAHRSADPFPTLDGIGAIVGLSPSDVSALLKGPRMPYQLSKDGQIFPTERLTYGERS